MIVSVRVLIGRSCTWLHLEPRPLTLRVEFDVTFGHEDGTCTLRIHSAEEVDHVRT
jgi:hypothetical protein